MYVASIYLKTAKVFLELELGNSLKQVNIRSPAIQRDE